ANALGFERQGTNQWARLLGYIRQGDPGDVFWIRNLPPDSQTYLPELPAGTEIRLGCQLPSTSPLVPVLEVLGSSGNLLAAGADGQTNLVFSVPADGRYYARIRAASGTGLSAQYLLQIQVITPVDVVPPQILADTLPNEGTTVTSILDRFSLVFSEDMLAATVNDPASYELRHAGADAVFGTSDDSVYALLVSPAYSLGTNVTLLVTDGPVQAGRVRFTAKVSLQDANRNPLPAPYVRTFEIAGVPGFVMENRSNDTFWGGTSLGVGGVVGADGS
ncbi:Ig-like domain-containing protein, partial [Limisphaera sp. VF-2]|uniref:Ig-like domain-containing protein n=1 Tax=Limisphaera sp. VF-2 TaxID=3400418 RepID=UPI003C1ABB63